MQIDARRFYRIRGLSRTHSRHVMIHKIMCETKPRHPRTKALELPAIGRDLLWPLPQLQQASHRTNMWCNSVHGTQRKSNPVHPERVQMQLRDVGESTILLSDLQHSELCQLDPSAKT